MALADGTKWTLDSSFRLDPPYELLGQIGTGGMATVYRARDSTLGREVAVKVLHSNLLDDAKQRIRFLREAQVLARVSHPNVVQIYACSRPEHSKPYLVLELVSGSTLERWIAAHGPLPWEVALALAERCLRGLEKVHEQDILHRDIKPANILLSLDGTPKLGDFGIARAMDVTGITGEGGLPGTIRYMPPEAFQSSEPGFPGDIYAMGCVLYEMLAGSPPFPQTMVADLIQAILSSAHPPLESAPVRLWPDGVAAVKRAMARQPQDRFPTAQAMRETCQSLLREVGLTDPELLLASYLMTADPGGWLRQLRSGEVQTLASRGRLHQAQGEDCEALALLDRIVFIDPDCPEIDALTAHRPSVRRQGEPTEIASTGSQAAAPVGGPRTWIQALGVSNFVHGTTAVALGLMLHEPSSLPPEGKVRALLIGEASSAALLCGGA